MLHALYWPLGDVLVFGQIIGGYFYDPFFDPHPWWPRTLYPYRWSPRFDGRAHVRIIASPKHAAVYVDGYYAGVVDEYARGPKPRKPLPLPT